MPFTASERAGVLTLTLDTPGSPVNIFNEASAEQLVELLRDVTPATTRAVVFASAKPNSFMNGVGLLLAHATRSVDDVMRASAIPWAAYRAVHECPVPTIALVNGTCFGCGVEFALSCHYRVATDSGETQFYMTEVNDYLFVPPFGATWHLPEAVGLAHAIELLLWGVRWDAATAVARGLVDGVVPYAARDDASESIAARALSGGLPSRLRGRVAWGAAEDDVVLATRRRIAELPRIYQPLYERALELLVAGALQRETYLEHQRHELEHSAASALDPIGKAAYGFFYLRQMAAERAVTRMRTPTDTVTLSIDAATDGDAGSFLTTLRTRPFPGLAFGTRQQADIHLVGVGRARQAADVAVCTRFATGPTSGRELYVTAGGRLIELAAADTGDDLARLARILQRFGYEVARTAPDGVFLTTRMLIAYLAPLVRFVAADGDARAVVATLRNAGFIRTPSDVLAGLDRTSVAQTLAPAVERTPEQILPYLAVLAAERSSNGHDAPLLLAALCITLTEAAHDARATRTVRDPSVIDLVARELLDFPRHLTSLCVWLKRSRVADAVAHGAHVEPLVPAHAFAIARAFAAEGREFYR